MTFSGIYLNISYIKHKLTLPTVPHFSLEEYAFIFLYNFINIANEFFNFIIIPILNIYVHGKNVMRSSYSYISPVRNRILKFHSY